MKKHSYRKYFFISIGGFIGAMIRFYFKGSGVFVNHGAIPVSTLFVNLTGSFLLAIFLTFAVELWELDADIKLGVATGLFGAYTTFSTFCKEFVLMIDSYSYYAAVIYLINSVLLGLIAAYLGIITARKVIILITREEVAEDSMIVTETREEEA